MLMVIFGAGASYDSAPTYPPGGAGPPVIAAYQELNMHFRPPLADQLFQNRPMYAEIIERFRECLPIVDRLRNLKGETLEAALQSLQAETDRYPRGLQQLHAVRYYLQIIIAQAAVLGDR